MVREGGQSGEQFGWHRGAVALKTEKAIQHVGHTLHTCLRAVDVCGYARAPGNENLHRYVQHRQADAKVKPPATATAGGATLLRALGRWDLLALVINGIVGAGIFGLPAKVQSLLGAYGLVCHRRLCRDHGPS